MSSAAGDREQKMLDSTTQNLSERLTEVRKTLGTLITKMETDPRLNWHSYLDSHALISGQLNSLLKSVKTPERSTMTGSNLRRYTTLPLNLSADRDEELARLTDQRVGTFSHDLVPHYLRTKPEPEVENKYATYEQRVANIPTDTLYKQMNVLDKVTDNALKVIARERDDIESREKLRNDIDKTTNHDDTMLLVAAVTSGKGIRPPGQQTGAIMSGSQMANSGQQRPISQVTQSQAGPKAPSAIKTNIKAGNQVHPYNRN